MSLPPKKMRVGGVSLSTFNRRLRKLTKSQNDVIVDFVEKQNHQSAGESGTVSSDSDAELTEKKEWDELWQEFHESDKSNDDGSDDNDQSKSMHNVLELVVPIAAEPPNVAPTKPPIAKRKAPLIVQHDPAKRRRPSANTVPLDHNDYIKVEDPLFIYPELAQEPTVRPEENAREHVDTANPPMTCFVPNDPIEGTSKAKSKRSGFPKHKSNSSSRLREEFERQKNSSEPPTLESVHALLMAFTEYTVEKIHTIEERQVKIQKCVNKISMATMAIASYEENNIPIDDVAGAKSCEKMLKSNEEARTNLISQINRKKEGQSDDVAMNSIFRYLFTDKFMSEFNLNGVSGKKSFMCELKFFYHLIIGVWKDQDVDKLIRKAIDRSKSRWHKSEFAKRQAAKLEDILEAC